MDWYEDILFIGTIVLAFLLLLSPQVHSLSFLKNETFPGTYETNSTLHISVEMPYSEISNIIEPDKATHCYQFRFNYTGGTTYDNPVTTFKDWRLSSGSVANETFHKQLSIEQLDADVYIINYTADTFANVSIEPVTTINYTYCFETEPFAQGDFNITYQLGTDNYTIDPTISACGTLNTANAIYDLTTSILNYSTPGSCFYIQAANVTLDCHNYLIDGVGDPNYAAIIDWAGSTYYNQSTIKNCRFSDWKQAGWMTGSNSTVINISVSNSSVNSFLYTVAVNNLTMLNITLSETSVTGINFQNTNATVTNITWVYPTGNLFQVGSGSNITVYNYFPTQLLVVSGTGELWHKALVRFNFTLQNGTADNTYFRLNNSRNGIVANATASLSPYYALNLTKYTSSSPISFSPYQLDYYPSSACAYSNSTVFTLTGSQTRNVTEYPSPYYNIWAYDEDTLASLYFSVTLTNVTNTTTNNYTNNYQACFTVAPSGSVDVTVSNNSYYYRKYDSITIFGSNTTINAYLPLVNAYSHGVSFIVQNQNSQPISDALVTVQKYINSAWTTVGNLYTDSSGVSYFYLSSLNNYKITVSAAGFIDQVSTVSPSSSSYVITLGQSTTGSGFPNQIEGTTWSYSPSSPWPDNQSASLVVSVTAANCSLSSWGYTLYNYSTVLTTVSSTSACGGNTTPYSITPGPNAQLKLETNFQIIGRDAFSEVTYIRTFTPSIIYYGGWQDINASLNRTGGLSGGSGAFSPFAWTLILLVIGVMVAGWVGQFSPTFGVMSFLIVMAIGGWFSFGLIGVGAITLLMIMISVAYYAMRGPG